MRIAVTILVKGTTAIATTDTIGIRFGATYADSVELASFTATTTSIITSLAAYAGLNGQLAHGPGSYNMLGSTAGNTLALAMVEDDAGPSKRFWIRRNTAQLANGVATLTDVGPVVNWPGKVRDASQLQMYFRSAIIAGVDAGLTASNAVIT